MGQLGMNGDSKIAMPYVVSLSLAEFHRTSPINFKGGSKRN